MMKPMKQQQQQHCRQTKEHTETLPFYFPSASLADLPGQSVAIEMVLQKRRKKNAIADRRGSEKEEVEEEEDEKEDESK